MRGREGSVTDRWLKASGQLAGLEGSKQLLSTLVQTLKALRVFPRAVQGAAGAQILDAHRSCHCSRHYLVPMMVCGGRQVTLLEAPESGGLQVALVDVQGFKAEIPTAPPLPPPSTPPPPPPA